MGYRLAPDAQQDLRDISLYVDGVWGAAASRAALARIKRSIQILGRHPSLGRARDHDLGRNRRSLPSGRHIIIYSAEGRMVTILRIVDGRRDYPAIIHDT